MADEADDRWTVRGVPRSYRQAAADAADRVKTSQGRWLCEAIDLKIQHEREPFGALIPPSDKPADVSALADLAIRLTDAVCRLAATKGVPLATRKRANATLLACLPETADASDGTPVQPSGPRLPPPDAA